MMRLSNIVSKKLMPLFMRSDSFNAALCDAIDDIVKDMDERINQNIRFWDNFDNMTEEQLDEAADELKVHWYRYDVDVEQKREIIKNAKYIKRKLGTVWAVEEILKVYFGDALVVEYWNYGGKKKHFKIQTWNSNTINRDAEMFLSVLDKIKRKGAILDYIEILERSTNEILYVITPARVEVIENKQIGGYV